MKTTRKILSLVTTLAATSAAAEPAKPPAHWDPNGMVTAVMLGHEPYMIAFDKAPVAISPAEYGKFLGETQPLVGPDGRPGCGNIATKGTTADCSNARATALAARIAAAKRDKAIADREAALNARTASRVLEAEQSRRDSK
jgi:hypothetical protein